jgi:hypothetical protein
LPQTFHGASDARRTHVLFNRRSSGGEEKCKRDNCGSGQHSFRTSIASKATIRRQVCRLEMALAAPSSPRRAGRLSISSAWAQMIDGYHKKKPRAYSGSVGSKQRRRDGSGNGLTHGRSSTDA